MVVILGSGVGGFRRGSREFLVKSFLLQFMLQGFQCFVLYLAFRDDFVMIIGCVVWCVHGRCCVFDVLLNKFLLYGSLFV